MAVAVQLHRMGRPAFEAVVKAVEAAKGSIGQRGLSLAEFEALALRDVPPNVVNVVVRSLHNRRVIFARRNRGEVKIFSERPAEITGVFPTADAIDRMLSATVAHMRALAAALADREAAKAAGDTIGARDARDRVDVNAGRLVERIRAHVAKGLDLADVRRELWALFPADAMHALAIFDPGLAERATGSLSRPAVQHRRIANGLSLRDRVEALIESAADAGLTRSALANRIRPRPGAADLGEVLECLNKGDRIKAREVRVKGPKRVATRYFINRKQCRSYTTL